MAGAFVCEICFEEQSERLELPELRTGNGDVLRAGDCNHPICRECLSKYVAVRVEEQRVFNLRCPHEGCKAELFEQDLQRLVQAGLLDKAHPERFTEMRARDFTARAKGFVEVAPNSKDDSDFETVRCLWETTRLCPRCSLAIERSAGCNSFFCVCGHHFNYSQAPRAVGNGIKHYDRVISLARNQSLALSEAEKFGNDLGMFYKASKIRAQSGLPLQDAYELVKKAMAGDEEARVKIRQFRQSKHPLDTGNSSDGVDASEGAGRSLLDFGDSSDDRDTSEGDAADSDDDLGTSDGGGASPSAEVADSSDDLDASELGGSP
eukprot:CAMPEP_0171057714 /NCGR_PEP_ID=MMETSP0766_2-20121228/2001_1 /TAXON_ID=439317 /ORGANISM="Gambierdiscus australes, Strain CAWD 149" /LENGTH=320 /DNA_ID=CAMNT_0011512893 /DNA_START=48 /DNA_END=1006 /DNA_ORIENTATION=+